MVPTVRGVIVLRTLTPTVTTVGPVSTMSHASVMMSRVNTNNCPYCNSTNTTRFQWVEEIGFQYWRCWDCDSQAFCVPIGDI